jgi:leader peptidase (prepilin peptidase)/N-methyltransferase
MDGTVILFLFFLGLAVGSFLNVVIDRVPHGESIVKGRSYCDHCKHKLSWIDLIPIVSFFILGRRCRYCKRVISWQYPTVEAATGVMFPLIYISAVPLWQYIIVIFAGLLVIFVTDFKYRIIPDQVLFFITLITLLYSLILAPEILINRLLSGLIMIIIFLILVVVTKGKGMGFGDVKFSFLMGLFLGFPKIIVAFYLAFLTGAAISLILVLIGKKTMKSKIAFGPFLVYATVIAFFLGNQIFSMFTNLLGI